MEIFRIEPKLIPAKIGCFLGSAYVGSFITILNVFFISVGINEVQAGVLTAMMYTSCILTGPMWGYLADYTGKKILILVVLCTGAAVSISSLPWTAYGLNMMNYRETDNRNISYIDIQSDYSATKDSAKDVLFYFFLGIMITASAFVLPLMAYFEAIAASVAKIFNAPFGVQRIFGEIGISSLSIMTGIMCDHFTLKDVSVYTPAFLVFPVICLTMIPVGHRLIRQMERASHTTEVSIVEENHESVIHNAMTLKEYPQNEQHAKQSSLPQNIGAINVSKEAKASAQNISETLEHVPKFCDPDQVNVGSPDDNSLVKKTLHLLATPSVLLFLVTVFIRGEANGIYFSFTFKFLVGEMKRSNFEASIVLAMRPITSCISFIFAEKFIKWFGGTIPTMAVSLFVVFIRLLVLSFNIPYGVFLSVCLLNGFSFAIFYASMMKHILNISPTEITMTMNHITLALFFYVGSLVANIGGSKVYDEYGGRKLFFGQSIACGVWAFLLFLYLARKKMLNKIEHFYQG